MVDESVLKAQENLRAAIFKEKDPYKIKAAATELKAAAGPEQAPDILANMLHEVLDKSNANYFTPPRNSVVATDTLIQLGANLDKPDARGKELFYKALLAQGNIKDIKDSIRPELVDSFLSAGVDVNKPFLRSGGDSPLHVVANSDLDEHSTNIARRLLAAGANPIAYNNNEKTPADVSYNDSTRDLLVAAEQKARGASRSKPEIKEGLYAAAQEVKLEDVKAHVEELRASYGTKGTNETLGNALLKTVKSRYISTDEKKPVIAYLQEAGAENQPEYIRAAIQNRDEDMVAFLLERKMSAQGALHSVVFHYSDEHHTAYEGIARSLIAAGEDATESRKVFGRGPNPVTPAGSLAYAKAYEETHDPEQRLTQLYSNADRLIGILNDAEVEQTRAKALAKEAPPAVEAAIPAAQEAAAAAPAVKAAASQPAGEQLSAEKPAGKSLTPAHQDAINAAVAQLNLNSVDLAAAGLTPDFFASVKPKWVETVRPAAKSPSNAPESPAAVRS